MGRGTKLEGRRRFVQSKAINEVDRRRRWRRRRRKEEEGAFRADDARGFE